MSMHRHLVLQNVKGKDINNVVNQANIGKQRRSYIVDEDKPKVIMVAGGHRSGKNADMLKHILKDMPSSIVISAKTTDDLEKAMPQIQEAALALGRSIEDVVESIGAILTSGQTQQLQAKRALILRNLSSEVYDVQKQVDMMPALQRTPPPKGSFRRQFGGTNKRLDRRYR